MDFKFTFEDGSEAIAHYGVKGMKWRQHKAQQEEDYKNESEVNAMEFTGDAEGLKRAQRRTDNFYGKNGKLARVNEARRRRRSAERLEAALKSQGMKRGSDGVWRKG